jgi:elongation factor 1-gamma
LNHQLIFIQAYTQAIETNYAALFAAEQHLASRTFLITEHITVADIYLANAVKMCISYTVGQEERARYPSVIRHFERIYNIPEIKAVFGKAEHVDKPPVFTPKKDEKV